jgi:sensor histidine kinase YesM
MNNSIQISFDLDVSLLREKLPRLSIQPIIENAVMHGLKNKRGEKTIAICARREDSDIFISVTDNGTGMDVDEINERMKNSLDEALIKNSSVGLDNINARIKLLYGDEYGVVVESGIGEGSCVSIRIPLTTARGEAAG